MNRVTNHLAGLTRAPLPDLDGHETRRLLVEGREAHVYVELWQDVELPDQLGLELSGTALEHVGSSATATNFELRDAGVLRALGEALLVLADRAEVRGMLAPLRAARGGRS